MTYDLKGPSKSLILLCFGFFVLTVISFWAPLFFPNFGGYTDKNFYGFILGGFCSVVALARFEYVDAIRIRTRKWYEWSLIPGKRLARWLTLASWFLSIWHAISWVRELTRIW